MYVLGIGITHNATACLMKDGKIIAAASEERFTREKNFTGYPSEAVRFVLEFEGISLDEVEIVAHGYIHGGGLFTKRPSRVPVSFNYIDRLTSKLFLLFPNTQRVASQLYYIFNNRISQKHTLKMLKDGLGNQPHRVELIDHHLCHASVAYYGFASADRPILVFTHDGEGDRLCATVSIGNGLNLERISSTKAGNSLAALYGAITKLLGMKILEDEYKVMGLAPYASDHEVHKTYTLLRQLIEVQDLTFRSKYGFRATYEYLKSALVEHRFDGIAGAVQKLCEELCIEWIRNGIEKTGINDVALGGGLFLNVKVNMRIMQMPEVNTLYPLLQN
jgi:carbamoyltransferase